MGFAFFSRCSFNDSSSKRYHRLYNCSKGQIRIEPFVPFKYPGMEFWLQAPNQVFLEHMSTSPKVCGAFFHQYSLTL